MDKNLQISFSKVYEFFYAMILAANDITEDDIDKAGEKYTEEINNYKAELTKNLSSFMKSELRYFFIGEENICTGIGQVIFYNFIHNYPEIEDVMEFIKVIEDSDPLDISRSILQREYTNIFNRSLCRRDEAAEKYPDLESILKEYNNLKVRDSDRRKKHLECIENPEEVKQRIVILLKGFYDKVFKGILGTIEEIVQNYIEIYNKELLTDKKSFFRKYTLKDSSVFKKNLRIYLSYSRFLGSDYWTSDMDDEEFLVIGVYGRGSLDNNNDSERIMNFLKTVGDKKRMAIINILKSQPAYVAEIAERMNMTAPTVCYHLTALQEYDIVDFERYDHRFYYRLNKDKLKEWFDKTTGYYLK